MLIEVGVYTGHLALMSGRVACHHVHPRAGQLCCGFRVQGLGYETRTGSLMLPAPSIFQ